MKTAVILTGHMRSFERCLPTLHWHVFRHFPGADFFVSTVADANAIKANLLRVKYPAARVEIEAVPEQPDCVAEMRAKGVNLPAEWTKGVPYTHEPFPISVHPQAVLRQLWQLERGWELMGRVLDLLTIPFRPPYDVVIRCRPDLWFHSALVPTEPAAYEAFLPWWGRFGGVNDRFAIMGRNVANGYFTTYSQIPEHVAEGCPIHPESLVGRSLENAFAQCQTLHAEFSTLRENGQMRAPEISTFDLARLHA